MYFTINNDDTNNAAVGIVFSNNDKVALRATFFL